MRAQVELFEHVAAGGVDENDVIGKIVGDQQSVGDAWRGDHGKAGGIRNDGSLGRLMHTLCDFLPRGNVLRRNLYKAIPSDLALMKAINCDPVSGVARFFAGRVSNRTNRSVKMLAI